MLGEAPRRRVSRLGLAGRVRAGRHAAATAAPAAATTRVAGHGSDQRFDEHGGAA